MLSALHLLATALPLASTFTTGFLPHRGRNSTGSIKDLACDEHVGKHCENACGRLGRTSDCSDSCLETCQTIASKCFDGGACSSRHQHCHTECDVESREGRNPCHSVSLLQGLHEM